MSHPPIYLDAHSKTHVAQRVLAEMLPYFTENFGNPASNCHIHGFEKQMNCIFFIYDLGLNCTANLRDSRLLSRNNLGDDQ